MAGEDRRTSAGTGGPIRVLLADDHTMFREGLAGVLASHGGLEVVAEVPNDGDALRLARELRPDAVVMQVQMPFERAKETLGALRAFGDPPKVVICTMLESPRHVRELTGAGASAYVLLRRAPRGRRARRGARPGGGTTWWWGCPAPCWRAPRVVRGVR